MNALRTCAVVPLLVLLAGCGRGPTGSACPAALDPSHMSNKQLAQVNIASVPRQGATSLANVRTAEKRSRRFIKENYLDVVEIGIGPGWGATYAQDDYGNVTFRHGSDHMLVAVVGKRSECPDPGRGTLFVFGEGDLRVPVRFLYRHAG
jgi:hypothetical protein